jgi:hypothetical protein
MAKAEEPWTQLATRIPKELHRRLKLHCVMHDIVLMHAPSSDRAPAAWAVFRRTSVPDRHLLRLPLVVGDQCRQAAGFLLSS